MSQSSKTLHEFGSLVIKEDARLKLGSVTGLSPSVTPVPVELSDADNVLTVSDIRKSIVTQTPSVARNLTLPTAELLGDFFKFVGDSIDFHVINEGSAAATLVAGAGGSLVGEAAVAAGSSATFRLRQATATTYVGYRL